MLAKSKLNSIESLISQALIDLEISHEEFITALKEIDDIKLKKPQNIDKNKTLKAIDEISKKNDEANKLLSGFRNKDETLDNVELVCTKTDGTKYNFNRFLSPLKFIKNIHKYESTLDETIEKQSELKELINKLKNEYKPRSTKQTKREEKSFTIFKKIV